MNISAISGTVNEYWSQLKAHRRKSASSTLEYASRKRASWISEKLSNDAKAQILEDSIYSSKNYDDIARQKWLLELITLRTETAVRLGDKKLFRLFHKTTITE